MRPVQSTHDSGDGRLCYAEVCRDVRLSPTGRDHLSDLGYVGLCEFRVRMGGAVLRDWDHVPLSILANHVRYVVGISPQEKVIRPNAGRIVASVKHEQSIRNRSVSQDPSHTMGGPSFTLEAEGSVTGAISVRSPNPAVTPRAFSAGLVDLLPEAFRSRFPQRVFCGATMPKASVMVATEASTEARPRALWDAASDTIRASHFAPPVRMVRSRQRVTARSGSADSTASHGLSGSA